MYCKYCGASVTPDARFCASCGAPVDAEAIVPAAETAPVTVSAPAPYDDGAMDYSVVLYSIGTCARSYADDLLVDILGYTGSEARQILRVLPTEIARLLTFQQAQYVAQALTEYGMQVVVLKGDAEIDIAPYATSTVYNSDGSFLSGVLTALAAITAANRVRSFRRWTRMSLLSLLFTPRYRWTQPRHVRHIQQRPAVIRTSAPAPRQSMPRKLEQPRRTGDVIRDVGINRDNRSGVRSSGASRSLFTGGKASSGGARPTGGSRPSGGGHGGGGHGGGGHGGHR